MDCTDLGRRMLAAETALREHDAEAATYTIAGGARRGARLMDWLWDKETTALLAERDWARRRFLDCMRGTPASDAE